MQYVSTSSSSAPLDGGRRPPIRPSQTEANAICEVHVTLGRLAHVKERHAKTAALMMQSLADAGAGEAAEAGMARVRGQYEALKTNLEKLYRKSMADLQTHKVALEAPTRARVELVTKQQNEVGKVEDELKALMANLDMWTLSELPQAIRRANKLLKASLKLIGLRSPEVKPVSADDFPRGRLDNVIIAPKRSGDRGRALDNAGSVSTTETGQQQQEPIRRRRWHHNEEQRLSSPPFRAVVGDEPPSSRSSQATAAAAAAKAAEAALREEATALAHDVDAPDTADAAAAAAVRKCCRHSKCSRGPIDWDEEPLERDGDACLANHGSPQEACSHCACACRADNVWAAYRTLRKRYHALKQQADKEEVRASVEEQRREMRHELDRERREMQAELDKRREVLDAEFESKTRALKVEMDEKAKREAEAAAAAAAVSKADLGLSKAEVKSLREMVHMSVKESRAVQQESTELREMVAVGERRLQKALQEAVYLRGEIAKREQHGEILLSRIRFLKGQTSACVKSTDWRKQQQQGEFEVNPVHPSSPARSKYGSHSDTDDGVNRQNRVSDGRGRPPPSRLEGSLGDESDDGSGGGGGHGHGGRGLRSPLHPLPRARGSGGRDGGMAEGVAAGAWTGSEEEREAEDSVVEGGKGDEYSRARYLERARKHLTREVYRLSAQLEVDGDTSTSVSLSGRDDALGARHVDSAAAAADSASEPVGAPPSVAVGTAVGRSWRGRQEAAAAAAEAAEAAVTAVAAAERTSRIKAAPSRRDQALRRLSSDCGGDHGDHGDHGCEAWSSRRGQSRCRENQSPPTGQERDFAAATAVANHCPSDDSHGGSTISGYYSTGDSDGGSAISGSGSGSSSDSGSGSGNYSSSSIDSSCSSNSNSSSSNSSNSSSNRGGNIRPRRIPSRRRRRQRRRRPRQQQHKFSADDRSDSGAASDMDVSRSEGGAGGHREVFLLDDFCASNFDGSHN